jgi:hypothetical protein
MIVLKWYEVNRIFEIVYSVSKDIRITKIKTDIDYSTGLFFKFKTSISNKDIYGVFNQTSDGWEIPLLAIMEDHYTKAYIDYLKTVKINKFELENEVEINKDMIKKTQREIWTVQGISKKIFEDEKEKEYIQHILNSLKKQKSDLEFELNELTEQITKYNELQREWIDILKRNREIGLSKVFENKFNFI